MGNNDEKQKILQKAHQQAFKKAKGKLPEKSMNELIELAKQLASDKEHRLQIMKEFAMEYKDFGIAYAKEFGAIAVDNALKNSDNEIMQKLGKDKLGKVLGSSAIKIGDSVMKYRNGKMTEEEFVKALSNSGLKDVAMKIMNAADIHPEQMLRNPEMVLNLAMPVVAYNASMAAYKEYEKALHDLELAREERLMVEAECRKSTDLILAYRKEMEERVSEYLSEHIEAFETGFAMMDQAILENDTDGFIKGNTEIQKMLGYDVQFTNQEEFDDLMDSDFAFKL